MILRSLKQRAEFQRKAGEIYGAIVTQARQPAFYARLGIPDTPTGRYEMVVIHLFLVLERLRREGAAAEPVAQRLVDAFVSDIDDSLRELGTGDTGVPRRVKRAAAGFYERAKAYREGIAAGARSLELALTRYIGEAGDAGIEGLADYMRAAGTSLAQGQTIDLMEARVPFPDPSAAARSTP